MFCRPPCPTHTDTLVPYTTLFLSTRPRLQRRRGLDPQPRRGQPELHHPAVPAGQAAVRPDDGRARGAQGPEAVHQARLHHDAAEELLPNYLRFRSEEHTSELQSLMRISYAVFCLKKTHDADN